MPRPPFDPDDQQQRILQALASLGEQRRVVDASTDQTIKLAAAARIPIDWIAKTVGLTRKTVYRHLGKPMK